MKATSLLKSVILFMLLGAIAACGRAGPLEAPPASVSQNDPADEVAETKEDKPFVLDRLLN